MYNGSPHRGRAFLRGRSRKSGARSGKCVLGVENLYRGVEYYRVGVESI